MTKEITASDMGKKGGAETLRKYGKQHYVVVGKKGGDLLLKKRGKEYFKRIRRLNKTRPVKDELATL